MSSSRHTLAADLADQPAGGSTRASFILRGALVTAATYGACSVTPFVAGALAEGDSSDADVLKFALELEYLEAAFYEQAVTQVKGLGGEHLELAKQLRDDEAEHVSALLVAIKQSGAIPLNPLRKTFVKAFASPASFLEAANILEDIGVSAYNGAATQIRSRETLAAAGSIVQVEARHAALIRLARGRPPAPVAFDQPRETSEVLQALKPFIDV